MGGGNGKVWRQREDGFGQRAPVGSLGGAGRLQRWAGRGAAFLSGQQDTADAQAFHTTASRWRQRPFLDSGGVLVVEALDAVEEVVHLHLFHLKRPRKKKEKMFLQPAKKMLQKKKSSNFKRAFTLRLAEALQRSVIFCRRLGWPQCLGGERRAGMALSLVQMAPHGCWLPSGPTAVDCGRAAGALGAGRWSQEDSVVRFPGEQHEIKSIHRF